MLNSFEVSVKSEENYNYHYEILDDLTMRYNHDNLFTEFEEDGKRIVCYGYCFDVRNPSTNVLDTLKTLAEADDMYEDLKYLNGHYILLFNLLGSWKLITDAVSMTPVYYDVESKKVTTSSYESIPSLNGFLILNLNDFTVERIKTANNRIKDERLERIILDLVMYQYKYFEDKEMTFNFRRNRMNKALISVLRPVLFRQYLNLRESDALTEKIGNQLAREYKMQLMTEAEEIETLYVGNTHLMNYNSYISKTAKADEETTLKSFHDFNVGEAEHKERIYIEHSLQEHLRYRNEKRNHLIFDPFNVPAIQERVYHYIEEKNFKPLDRIIKILHPSIDFYDFATGETLLRKYNKIKKQYEKLSKEVKNYTKNAEFLNIANIKGIRVTENLDGTVLDDGITFYPAKQSISKDEIFEVNYKKQGQGMVLVESYFNNPRNAHRIKVEVNGTESDIDEFLEGKFINVNSELSLKMRYERSYETASWQKAGKITIKEID